MASNINSFTQLDGVSLQARENDAIPWSSALAVPYAGQTVLQHLDSYGMWTVVEHKARIKQEARNTPVGER